MKTSFNQKAYNEFPPTNKKWQFTKNGLSSNGLSLSESINLARVDMHSDGYSLSQQDSVLAIAVNQCILHGAFQTGVSINGNFLKKWEIKYIMTHTDTMYPPYGTWRMKYGKLPELPQ